MAEELERIYIIPLKKLGHNQSKAAPTAIKRVKHFLTRHMKVEEEKIWIDDSLNKAIWAQGKFKILNKIRVKAVKFDDGVVEAYLPELEFKKSRRELLKEEREKKEPILRKEEAAPEEAEGEAPTEKEYQITPTAQGDVKIKKKKTPKPKESEEKISEEKPLEEKPAEEKEKKEEKKKPAKKKTAEKKTEKKESKTKTKSKTASKEKTGSEETEKK
jgi:large subunit ribosomal protein L31e